MTGQQNLHDYLGPHWWPQRGLGPVPPQDPVVYRLFEVRLLALAVSFLAYVYQGVMVYGQAIKVC
jgi:cyanate lyase